MKRLIFVRDKKVVKMYIVYIILGLLLNILALTEIIKPLVYNTSYIFFAMAISLIIDIIILKKLSSIVRLYDDKIKIGYLFSRTIYIKDIKDINKINYILFNDTIELNVKYQYSNIKINVFPFGNDREKYKTLLKHINDRSEEKFNVDVALDRLNKNQKQKYQTGNYPLKYRGWTKLLVYHITVPVIGAGLMVLSYNLGINNPNIQTITLSNYIQYLITLITGIIVLPFVYKKHVKAVLLIKIYLWISLFATQTTLLFSLIVISKSILPMDYVEYLFGFAPMILLNLIIIRSLTVSRQVKLTFVNEKLFSKKKIEKIETIDQ